jgi:hypothetical protein
LYRPCGAAVSKVFGAHAHPRGTGMCSLEKLASGVTIVTRMELSPLPVKNYAGLLKLPAHANYIHAAIHLVLE